MSKEYTRRISTLGNVPSQGPFIFFDDFEALLKWTKYDGPGDSIYELDPTIAYSGNQSLHIKSRTTNATENDIIGTRIKLFMTPSKKLNQSMIFRSPDFTKIKTIDFYHTLDDTLTLHFPTIRFSPAGPKWQYLDSAGDPQDIPGAIYPLSVNAWHRLHLLADLNTNKFISMSIDSRHYDLSNISIEAYSPGVNMYLDITAFIVTAGAAPAEIYIDDFLVHEL